MKVAIIGAGALGCLFGAGISKENEVIMLCHRQSQADSINRYGLAVYEPDGRSIQVRDHVLACLTGQYDGEADLLIVLTKTMDTAAAMEQNRHMISSKTMVLTLQNGGGNAEILEAFCPKERIFIGTTRHNSVNLGNGMIRHSGDGITYIGAADSSVSAQPLAELLKSSGFAVESSDNIRHLIWEKLFVNLSINSFTAIARAPIGACVSNENSWFFMEKLICEAVDVAKACGENFSYFEILNMVHATCEKVSGGFSSMSQDVMNCRRTEIDTINGYVVSQAKKYNIPTPYNELIRNLVHAVENTYTCQDMPASRYSAGTVILQEGQNNTDLYEIIEGCVRVVLHYGMEDEYLLGILGKGRCFGEMGSLIGRKEGLTVIAEDDAVVMKIPRESQHRFLALNPGNAVDIMKMIVHNTELLRLNTSLVLDELNDSEED